MSTNRFDSRGFTLVETMVAIAILAIAIVGPFTAAQKSLDAAYAARDQLIAASLAQEGLEYVREIRDNNYLAAPSTYDPFAGLDSAPDCRAPNACAVDATQAFGAGGAVQQCLSGNCSAKPLYIAANGTYNEQSNGTKTAFVRSVTLVANPAGAANVERATVTVSWTTGSKPYSITLSEDFYAWL